MHLFLFIMTILLLASGIYCLVIATKPSANFGYKNISYYFFGNRIWSITNRFFGTGVTFLASVLLFLTVSNTTETSRFGHILKLLLLYFFCLFILTELMACLKVYMLGKRAKPYEQSYCPKGHYQILWDYYLATSGKKLSASAKLLEFGNTPKMARELAQLVLTGEKVATSALVDYCSLRTEPPAKVGDGYFLLAGDGKPMAILEITEVREVNFGEVDEAFAKAQGDGTLANWLAIHEPYYQAQLKEVGQLLSKDTLIETMYFDVIYRY